MKSSFPNSSQFSPAQISLPELLRLVKQHQPDRGTITQAVTEKFFAERPDRKLAHNTIYALSEYKIIEKPVDDQSHASLTALGEALALKAENDEIAELYEEFARHILLNLRGLELIQVTDDLRSRGQKLTKATISDELTYRGFHIPRNGTHLNGMRQWLEKAGVVEERSWVARPEVVDRLLGNIDLDDVDEYAQLTPEQRAYALAFARLNEDEALSNKVADYATALYGVKFREGGLPQSTLFALRDVGLLTCEKTTGGQGAKPYIVRPTDKLRNEFLEPIFAAIESSAGIQYRRLIRMSFSEILESLGSESKHVKGLALEALVFYLGRLIGLDFVQWRLRSKQTGGAELDVIMERANLLFSRWQIQCKNTRQAKLDDIAKELGLAQLIKSNVIMIVTTGSIGRGPQRFAERVTRETNVQVVLLMGKDLRKIKADPVEIVTILRSQSERAMELKRHQVEDI